MSIASVSLLVVSVVCFVLVMLVYALVARLARESEWKAQYTARLTEIAFREQIDVGLENNPVHNPDLREVPETNKTISLDELEEMKRNV